MLEGKINLRKRIGVLVNYLYEGYQLKILSSLFSTAEKFDVDIFTFVGGNLDSDDPENLQRNRIYKLISKENIDGLIIMGLVLGRKIPKYKIVRFCKYFSRHIPTISLGLEIKDIPSIVVESKTGLKNLLIHLIEDLKYEKIAFVTGPPNNEEAKKRYETFIEVMKYYKRKVDPEFIYEGDFTKPAGINAIKTFLDERKIRPQVIVFSNDAMAISAIEELNRRNIKVPDDIAITGFDDIEEARSINPPLTTVRQPLFDLGKKGIELCYHLISEGKGPKKIVLSTQFVIRESCGWKILDKEPNLINTASKMGFQKFEDLIETREEFTKFASSNLSIDQENQLSFINELFASFLESLFYENNNFLQKLEKELHEEKDNIEIYNECLYMIYKFIYLYLKGEFAQRAENLIQKALLLVSKNLEKNLRYEKLKTDEETEQLGYIGSDLISSFNMQDIIDRVPSRLLELGIRSFYICLYDKKSPSKNANLILACKDGELNYEKITFPLKDLIPKELLPNRRLTFILETLHFQNNSFGYIILEYGPKRGIVYETFRSQISAAIQGALLFEEINKLAIIDSLTGVLNRRVLDDALQKEIARTKRYNRPLSVILLDIDNFKIINDTFGHKFGDEVLKQIANTLKKSCRKVDIVGRYGGDEFLIILPETSLANSVKIAEKIIKNINSLKILSPYKDIIYLRLSLGIASCPNNIPDPEELLIWADSAMYKAKNLGGNQYSIADLGFSIITKKS